MTLIHVIPVMNVHWFRKDPHKREQASQQTDKLSSFVQDSASSRPLSAQTIFKIEWGKEPTVCTAFRLGAVENAV
jgi:hypothetical protein